MSRDPGTSVDVERERRRGLAKLARTLRARGVQLPSNADADEIKAAAIAYACTDPAELAKILQLQEIIAKRNAPSDPDGLMPRSPLYLA